MDHASRDAVLPSGTVGSSGFSRVSNGLSEVLHASPTASTVSSKIRASPTKDHVKKLAVSTVPRLGAGVVCEQVSLPGDLLTIRFGDGPQVPESTAWLAQVATSAVDLPACKLVHLTIVGTDSE